MSEWTVKSALDWTTEYLEGKGDGIPFFLRSGFWGRQRVYLGFSFI